MKILKNIVRFFDCDRSGFATLLVLVMALALSGLSLINAPVVLRASVFVFLWLVWGFWFGKGIASLFPKIVFPFWILGQATVPYGMAVLLAPFLLWWRFALWELPVVLVMLTLLASWINFISEQTDIKHEQESTTLFTRISLVVACVLSLGVVGVAMLSRRQDLFLSLWEATNPALVVVIFALLLLVMGCVVRQKNNSKTLVIIVMATLAIQLLFPIMYDAGFSGDRWRHLATVQTLGRQEIVRPVLFGAPVDVVSLGGIKVPEVLVAGNKQSYVMQWSWELAVHQLTGVDLFALDQWFMPVVWAITIPLLLFLFGAVLEFSITGCLLLASIPLVSSVFFEYGATTLPKAFGFLPFLFFIIVAFSLLGTEREMCDRCKRLLIIGVVLGAFQYIVYAIVLLLVGVYTIFDHHCKHVWQRWMLACGSVIASVLLFPALDTMRGYSHIMSDRFVLGIGARLVAQNSWRFIQGQSLFPRPWALEQENVFAVQAYTALTKITVLTVVPWVKIITPILLLFVVVGAVMLVRHDIRRGLLFVVGVLGSLGAMVVSVVFLDGNHILSKRLVIITALFMLPLLVIGVGRLLRFLTHHRIRGGRLVVSVFVALSILVTLVSGPRIQRVTAAEVIAARKTFETIGTHSPCVIANTWPLLALEAVSGGKIVNGGFPLYPPEFSAPERVSLYEALLRTPSARYIQRALHLTGSKNGCVVMIEKQFLKPYMTTPSFQPFINLFGQPEMIGDVAIWNAQN